MFDKTFFSMPVSNWPRTTYVNQDVKVTEVRAPTDESIRLLKEMEDKVRDHLVSSIPVGGSNTFSARIHILRDFSLFDVYTAVVAFTLNGQSYQVKVQADPRSTQDEFIRKIISEVSVEITNNILTKAFESIDPDSERNLRGMS